MKLVCREYDPETGITDEYYSWTDEMGKAKLTIRRLQDVEPILEHNRAEFLSHEGKQPNYRDSNGTHLVARIPEILIEKWLREEGFNWYQSTDAERRRKLNDPQYRKLLVRPGKL